MTPKMPSPVAVESKSAVSMPFPNITYRQIVNVVDEQMFGDAMTMVFLVLVMVFGGLLVYRTYCSRKAYAALTEVFLRLAVRLET